MCKHCGGEYPEYWFRTDRSRTQKANGKLYRRFASKAPICKGCDRTARDKTKNRAMDKAYMVIKRHGKKLADKGIIHEPEELKTLYKWDVRVMAHELEHTYSNGCPVCHKSFANMGNGYRDVTLDIKDPKQKPYYGINTQWICNSCNISKGDFTMEEFGNDQYCWKIWEENQKLIAINPNHILPLFRDLPIIKKGDQLLLGLDTK